MQSPSQIQTYHCLCAQLILASLDSLTTLPTRKADGSTICTIATDTTLSREAACFLADDVSVSIEDSVPFVLKLEDGFEKRFPVACTRCGLTIGYQLDQSQYDDSKDHTGRRADVVYVLPGSLHTTDQMLETGGAGNEMAELTA